MYQTATYDLIKKMSTQSLCFSSLPGQFQAFEILRRAYVRQ